MKTHREVRVIAVEHEEDIIIPEEQFGEWESRATVKFEGVLLCDSDFKGGFGRKSGDWQVHKIFAKRAEAKAYVKENNLEEIFKAQKGYFDSFEDVEIHTVDCENQLL